MTPTLESDFLGAHREPLSVRRLLAVVAVLEQSVIPLATLAPVAAAAVVQGGLPTVKKLPAVAAAVAQGGLPTVKKLPAVAAAVVLGGPGFAAVRRSELVCFERPLKIVVAICARRCCEL